MKFSLSLIGQQWQIVWFHFLNKTFSLVSEQTSHDRWTYTQTGMWSHELKNVGQVCWPLTARVPSDPLWPCPLHINIKTHVCASQCVDVDVCQTLALAVPVWGGLLVLANSVWSYLLCFMFLASRGHKKPFVAKRWLVSFQTGPCSCSPLLHISVCMHVCVWIQGDI